MGIVFGLEVYWHWLEAASHASSSITYYRVCKCVELKNRVNRRRAMTKLVKLTASQLAVCPYTAIG
jgi:hypothetical protein